MATATASKTADEQIHRPVDVRPYEDQRLQDYNINAGEMLSLTLPGDEVITEGDQNCARWSVLGPRLHNNQWIVVRNDAESFFAVMMVERIFGGGGAAMRGLTLRMLIGPHMGERAAEKPEATGRWYYRWAGSYKKYEVINPAGQVRMAHITTEGEARNRMYELERNDGVARRQ